MNKREYMIQLQNVLMELANRVRQVDYKNDKYLKQINEFTPFNEEFKEIIAILPESFYLNDENDSIILLKIIELTKKIKLKIEAL